MLGDLPKTLEIKGRSYAIRTDYRSVLRIIAALADDDLSKNEKVYVMLRQIYPDFRSIPSDDYTEAYEKACWFLSCGQQDQEREGKRPQIVNWEKDEQLIFPAINKVAGFEVRLAEYMHWWTFMGLFHGIGSDDTYGYILMLRQKKSKGKKLEKWEQEFWNSNKHICEFKQAAPARQPEDAAADIFAELLKAQQEGKGA